MEINIKGIEDLVAGDRVWIREDANRWLPDQITSIEDTGELYIWVTFLFAGKELLFRYDDLGKNIKLAEDIEQWLTYYNNPSIKDRSKSRKLQATSHKNWSTNGGQTYRREKYRHLGSITKSAI